LIFGEISDVTSTDFSVEVVEIVVSKSESSRIVGFKVVTKSVSSKSSIFGAIVVVIMDNSSIIPDVVISGLISESGIVAYKKNIINRSSRRKRGMASNPLFIILFFGIFPMNFAMATLGLKEMRKFLWKGREKSLPSWLLITKRK
jgi:hypothetical protein